MATETFTWAPRIGAQGQTTLRVRGAQFGDGYKQTVADGINNKVQSWPLSFNGSKAKIQAIVDFLDRNAGAKSFYWTPPLGAQGLYKVVSYTSGHVEGAVYSLSATFEQAFRP